MTAKSIDVTSVEGLIRGAMSSGAVTALRVGRGGALSVDAEMHGRCLNPIEISRAGVKPGKTGETEVRVSSDHERRAINVTVRCRHCSACLAARGNHWRKAAEFEMARTALRGARTWFGTLTLRPDDHHQVDYAAMSRGGMSAWHASTDAQRLSLRNDVINRSITLALKRLRKEVGAGIRYLLVCEAHKSGLPHYHMLVHEASHDLPVRKSALNDFWPHGFSQWRLAEPHACRYVAKYLSKAAQARVRASQHYGSQVHSFPLREPSPQRGEGIMPLPLPPAPEGREGEVNQHGGL